MLPRKCFTICEVPYLCAIVCPLNARLEDLTAGEHANDVVIDEDEPLDVILAEEEEGATTETRLF